MNRFLLFFIVAFPLLASGQANSEKKQQLDSLRTQFKQDSANIYGFKKIRPYINYHERNSIKNPKTINFFGPQVGVLLYERHIIGIGAYFSTRNTQKPYGSLDGINPALKRIDIKYVTFFYQKILLQYRYFELHVPLEIGHGTLKTNYSDLDDRFYKTTKNKFTIAAVGTQLILKPIRWIGLSAIYGYRYADQSIINGFYYAFGVWIGFKPLLIDINYYYKRKKYRQELIKLTQG